MSEEIKNILFTPIYDAKEKIAMLKETKLSNTVKEALAVLFEEDKNVHLLEWVIEDYQDILKSHNKVTTLDIVLKEKPDAVAFNKLLVQIRSERNVPDDAELDIKLKVDHKRTNSH